MNKEAIKITHNGKQYEIGKWYKFKGNHCKLVDYRYGREEPFIVTFSDEVPVVCSRLREINTDALGTITDAPIELEDGCWYMCAYKDRKAVLYWDGALFTDMTESGLSTGKTYKKTIVTTLYKMERAK